MPNFPKAKAARDKKQGVTEYAAHSFKNTLYHTKQWKALRLAMLRDEPTCRECRLAGEVKLASVLDHIQPVRLGGEMWDTNNLQPLCYRCHARKSQSEKQKGRGDYAK